MINPLLRAIDWTGIPSGLAKLAGADTRLSKALALVGSRGDPARYYAVRRALFLVTNGSDIVNSGLMMEYLESGVEALLSSGPDKESTWGKAQMQLEMRNYLPNTLLRDTDIMSMRHGLEVRVPLLDEELVAFVEALPMKWKVQRGRQKPLLAGAVSGLPVAAPSKKRGFLLPFPRWMRGPIAGEVSDCLNSLEYSGPYLNRSAVKRLWAGFVAGDDRLWSRVWALYVLEKWLRKRQTAS
jgi:asparagine synthase (glutamine-hydrolysing)